MIKQYIKQALRMIGENKLLSMIPMLDTAPVICTIMMIVIPYVMNTASFEPEVNRGRTCYITTVTNNGKGGNQHISCSPLGLPLMKEYHYPLKGMGAVTAINMDCYRPLATSSMSRLKNRTGHISCTDTAFWKIFKFDLQQGGLSSPTAFINGIRDTVISESVILALFSTNQVVRREVKPNFIIYDICRVVKDVFRLVSEAWAEVQIPYTVWDDGEYQEGINGSYSCCILLKPGVTREGLRTEVLRKIKEFNARTQDIRIDVLHQPPTQIEERIGGGSEFGADPFYPYVRYGIILFTLPPAPALNLPGITLSRMRRRMAGLSIHWAPGATQDTILWQVLFENMVLTPLGGLLGLAMSYGTMLLLGDQLLTTSLGKTGLSTETFSGAVPTAAFLFCLVLNLFSIGLPAWQMSRLNTTDSINN